MRKKVIALLTCSIALTSCGKKIENTKTGDDTVVLNEANASNVKLELNFNKTGELSASNFRFSGEAWIKVPEAVFLKSGDVFTYSTRIYFNATEDLTLGNSPVFYCEYSAYKQFTGSDQQSIDGYNHLFKNCYEDVNADGTPEILNYLPGDEIPQDPTRLLKIELISSSAGSEDITEVYSDIEVDWR
jgi:hypothetical protein